MVVSTRLSRLRQTSQKHTRVDNACQRPGMEECLPLDALEAVMGHLNRETLRTARLVSKTFCAAASAHVCSLTVESTSQAISFLRFPHLSYVTVVHSYPNPPDKEDESFAEEESLLDEEKSLAQLDPRLRDLATTLTIQDVDRDENTEGSIAVTRDYLSQAALMPKLRKLEVDALVEHEAGLLARCTNLEALEFYACSESVAADIVTLTRLTSIAIGKVREDFDIRTSVDFSWLGHATNLRNLQALSIETWAAALPLIGNLTSLTGLTICVMAGTEFSIAPLTRLTRLRSLSLRGPHEDLTESNLGIACSLGSGSLVNLQLGVCHDAPADCGKYLSRQTALTHLTLRGPQLCNLQHIGALHVELLQCLELQDLDTLDAAGLSVLCRATSLTRLGIGSRIPEPHMGLTQTLAQLTQLHSLYLRSGKNVATNFLDLPLALSPLTGLTELGIAHHCLDEGNLRALLVLTGLCALHLEFCRLKAEVLPQLAVLTNLSWLRLRDNGIKSLAPVSQVLDPLREARGLPPLHTKVWGY